MRVDIPAARREPDSRAAPMRQREAKAIPWSPNRKRPSAGAAKARLNRYDLPKRQREQHRERANRAEHRRRKEQPFERTHLQHENHPR